MSNQLYAKEPVAHDGFDAAGAEAPHFEAERFEQARPIPRITVQAFCEMADTAEVIQVCAEDRRLSKAHVNVHMGGILAAQAHYVENPSPNLIILESGLERSALLGSLDQLAENCDAGTKVVVIGHRDDVFLYRELLKRGVSEYLVAPIAPLQLMESLSNLYTEPGTEPIGQTIAFIGAKGGVGSSTLCHNVAWTVSRMLKTNVVIADLDLPFGTAGLDFNQDPVQGIADALSSPERLDEVLLDRLLSKCTDHLSLFAAPSVLDRNFEIGPEAYEHVLDVVRNNVPFVTLDIPHVWTAWAKQVVLQADQVVITAAPDLANLRNAKNIVDLLKSQRKNDKAPHLVLNTVGLPKRPEIPVKEFTDALEIAPQCVIEYDAETFGLAANNGQMIEELGSKARAAEHIRHLACILTNRQAPVVEQKSVLAPILARLGRKKA